MQQQRSLLHEPKTYVIAAAVLALVAFIADLLRPQREEDAGILVSTTSSIRPPPTDIARTGDGHFSELGEISAIAFSQQNNSPSLTPMVKFFSVTATCLYRNSGNPMPSSTVWLAPEGDNITSKQAVVSQTDQDGKVVFNGVNPGDYTLQYASNEPGCFCWTSCPVAVVGANVVVEQVKSNGHGFSANMHLSFVPQEEEKNLTIEQIAMLKEVVKTLPVNLNIFGHDFSLQLVPLSHEKDGTTQVGHVLLCLPDREEWKMTRGHSDTVTTMENMILNWQQWPARKTLTRQDFISRDGRIVPSFEPTIPIVFVELSATVYKFTCLHQFLPGNYAVQLEVSNIVSGEERWIAHCNPTSLQVYADSRSHDITINPGIKGYPLSKIRGRQFRLVFVREGDTTELATFPLTQNIKGTEVRFVIQPGDVHSL